MNSNAKRNTIALALFVVGAGTVVGYQAGGAAMLAGQPTVVVSVNLGSVMEKLDQRAEADSRLKKMSDDLKAEQTKRMNKLDAMKEEATKLEGEIKSSTGAQLAAAEARLQKLQEDAALAALDYKVWLNFNSDKMDIESALVMQDLYQSVKVAVAQMANTNRYDVVLVDDAQGDLMTSDDARIPRVDQIRQQIAGRRMLYVNPTIDITDDLIARMNNAHKAVGPKPAGATP